LPSPTKYRHSKPHTHAALWFGTYAVHTPGTEHLIEMTNQLNGRNEPQPDALLRVLPEFGGQTTDTPDDYMAGPPELIAEVANTSASIDLNAKRREYEAAGVREYVVALARSKQVIWFARGRTEFADLPPGDDGILRSRVFPGLWLEPAALFERSPARVMAALTAGLASPEHAAFVAKLAARAAKPKPRKPKS
jgi:Uma2 family endonuclease